MKAILSRIFIYEEKFLEVLSHAWQSTKMIFFFWFDRARKTSVCRTHIVWGEIWMPLFNWILSCVYRIFFVFVCVSMRIGRYVHEMFVWKYLHEWSLFIMLTLAATIHMALLSVWSVAWMAFQLWHTVIHGRVASSWKSNETKEFFSTFFTPCLFFFFLVDFNLFQEFFPCFNDLWRCLVLIIELFFLETLVFKVFLEEDLCWFFGNEF